MIDLTTGTYIAQPPEAPQHSWLLEYIGKCKSGEIFIGHEMELMLDILLGHFDNPDIQIDFSDAQKRIRFIQENCRHAEAPFAGKKFILELFQRAFIEAIYSFKIWDEELQKYVRLYQDILFLVARKNGKTPLIAAICLAEWFCGPMGCKILTASNNYDQASLMFDAINNMREESPMIEKVTRKNIKGIYFGNPKQKKKHGKFSQQNKGNIRKLSERTGSKEGRNIMMAGVDECWQLADDSLIMPIRQALSTQEQPLYIELTTQGSVEDGYLDKRIDEARKVLRGELARPRWLIFMYTQNSESEIWQDEKTWVRSNPGIGAIKKWSFLRGMMEEAKTNSATRAFMLSRDYNIKQSTATSWMQESEIINPATYNIEDFHDCWYIGGGDFAETTDLCAFKMLLKKPGDPTVYFLSHYWIPNSKLTDAPDDVDYQQWARDGYLTIVPGNSVESSVVADWQFELFKDYGLMPYKVGYDNRFAKDYINHFNELFDDSGSSHTLEMVQQDAKCLNNPTRKLEADLRQKLVNYNNCFGDLVCFRNAGIKLDTLGRIQLAKKETKKRIDGAAAAVCCYAVYEWHKAEFQTLVEG